MGFNSGFKGLIKARLTKCSKLKCKRWRLLYILFQKSICESTRRFFTLQQFNCSLLHKGNPTRRNSVSKFYFIFIWSSTCFRRHTARHHEPKTALAASGFAYVKGCWSVVGGRCQVEYEKIQSDSTDCTFSYSTWQPPPVTRPTTLHVCKTRGCFCSFRFLMMGGVSHETCWASGKYEIKFWFTVASCWISYVNYIMMHGSTNINVHYLRVLTL